MAVIDRVQIEEDLRFLLGEVDVDVLSSITAQKIIEVQIAKYGDDDENYCKVLYESILEVCRHLGRKQSVDSASSIAGTITSRKEKEGNVTVEEDYSTTTSTNISWSDILSDFLKNPQYVCDSLVGTTTVSATGAIIGGADVNPYQGSIDSISTWEETLVNNSLNPKNNYSRW